MAVIPHDKAPFTGLLTQAQAAHKVHIKLQDVWSTRDRAYLAVRMKAVGYRVIDIAREIECSERNVYELIQQVRENEYDQIQRIDNHYRRKQLAVIDQLMDQYIPIIEAREMKAGDVIALTNLMNRQAKLSGADATTQVDINVKPVQEMTNDEMLARLQEIKRLKAAE